MSFTAPASLCDHISSLVPQQQTRRSPLRSTRATKYKCAQYWHIPFSRLVPLSCAIHTFSYRWTSRQSIRMGTVPLALTALHPSPLGHALPFVDRQTQSQRSKTSYSLPSQQGHQVNLSGGSRPSNNSHSDSLNTLVGLALQRKETYQDPIRERTDTSTQLAEPRQLTAKENLDY